MHGLRCTKRPDPRAAYRNRRSLGDALNRHVAVMLAAEYIAERDGETGLPTYLPLPLGVGFDPRGAEQIGCVDRLFATSAYFCSPVLFPESEAGFSQSS